MFNESKEDVLKCKSQIKHSRQGKCKNFFIRAFVSECEILFLDESTSNLDVESKKLITEILKQKNITIINSTHSPDDFDYDTHHRILLKVD